MVLKVSQRPEARRLTEAIMGMCFPVVGLGTDVVIGCNFGFPRKASRLYLLLIWRPEKGNFWLLYACKKVVDG